MESELLNNNPEEGKPLQNTLGWGYNAKFIYLLLYNDDLNYAYALYFVMTTWNMPYILLVDAFKNLWYSLACLPQSAWP